MHSQPAIPLSQVHHGKDGKSPNQIATLVMVLQVAEHQLSFEAEAKAQGMLG